MSVKPCPFCGLPPSRAAKSYGTPIVCCGNMHCTLGASDADWYEIGDWNQRPIEDALRAERDAALADVVAWRGFAGSVAVAVHPGDAGLVIADHLAVDDLPDLLAAVERVVEERDRLRAALAEAAADLPLHPEGGLLMPSEADAEAVRQALLAALRGGR
jgi:hypothetical protein